jgi:hypothetical protein
MGLIDVLYDLLLNFVEKYDAKRGIPRPVSHPDLTARHAALGCLMTAAKMFWLTLCGSIAAYRLLHLPQNMHQDSLCSTKPAASLFEVSPRCSV